MKETVLILMTLLLLGCKKEKVETCSENHYGPQCKAYNEFYVGNGNLNEECNPSGTAGYSVSIAASTSDPLSFSITGLWEEPSWQTTCKIKKNNRYKFVAAKQALGTTGFDIEIVNGSISSDGNIISYSYNIYSGNVLVEVCEGTIER